MKEGDVIKWVGRNRLLCSNSNEKGMECLIGEPCHLIYILKDIYAMCGLQRRKN